MDKQINKTPLVRFPEFKEGWEHKQLNELLSVSKTKNLNLIYSKEDVLSVSGELGIVNQIEHLGRSYAGVSVHNYGIVEVGQIVYTKSPLKANPYGIIKLNKHKAGIVSTLYAVYCVNEKTDGQFIEHYFSLDANLNRYLRPLVRKGAKNDMKISNEYVLNDRIFSPQLKEQQKIAIFLTAVDKKLQQLTKKKELLKEYKKGVIQKIFSQELRFKDEFGNNYPNWEEKKLGDIGEFKTSSVDKLIKEGEKMISLVNYMNVYNHQNITNENTKNLMQVSANEKQIETSNLKRGDILFTPSSETPSDIGHSIVIFKDLNNTLYSYHLMRFRPTITLDILYSHYFCNTPSVLRQITRFATGSTRFTISVGSFSKVIIQLPSLEEQQKIANFLSLLDSKIDLVITQIEKTKAFKKGLLQQMFV